MLGRKFLNGNITLREVNSEQGKETYSLQLAEFNSKVKLLRCFERDSRKDVPHSDHPLEMLKAFMKERPRHFLNNGDIALSITYMEPLGTDALYQNLRVAVRLKQIRNSEAHICYYENIGDATLDSCAAIGLRLHGQKQHRAAFHFLALAGKMGEQALQKLGDDCRMCGKLRLAVECFAALPKEGPNNLVSLGDQLTRKGDLYYAAKAYTVAGQRSRDMREEVHGRFVQLEKIAETVSDDDAQHELSCHLKRCMQLIYSRTLPTRFNFPNCLTI